MSERGKLIVIEGTDGSGKGTQVELLGKKLLELSVPFEVADFPQYVGNIYGKTVGRYLKGEFGQLESVNPYLVSLAYAGDRMVAKDKLWGWLNSGKLVIANRYVISNKIYMSARLPKNERKAYLDWEDELEYNANGIPREDLVVFLHVPPDISQNNLTQKGSRQYMGGEGKDIHEADLTFQDKVRQVYLEFAKREPNWAFIECTENGQMRTREDIHQEIVHVLKSRGILKL
jgi:dTMP kinase